MTTPLFSLHSLSYEFSAGAPALDAISASIPSGGCTALLGCNGAGKSTLLHLLAGLLTPTSGELRWHDGALSADILQRHPPLRSDFRRQVAIAFQDPDAQWLCETVQQEVEFGPMQIWPAAEARERAAQIMITMGINHIADRAPYMLSTGQKRRVALASILAVDPAVLLLDEPTAGLDAATMDFLLDWLLEFRSTPGKTVIMATHDLAVVHELATTALVLTPCHKLAGAALVEDLLRDRAFLRQMNLLSRRSASPQILF